MSIKKSFYFGLLRGKVGPDEGKPRFFIGK